MKFLTVRLRALLAALAMAAALTAGCFAAYATDAVQVWNSGTRSLPVYSVERTDNKIAISFDCAWGTEHTDAILAALAEAGVRATFFTVQFWAEEHPDYLKKIAESGHEVGTHSATHSYMSRLSEGEIRRELETSSQAIAAVTGEEVTLFRPPYGDYDDLLIDTCRAMGIFPVQWDVDSLDWKDLSAAEIADRVIARVRSGSIITRSAPKGTNLSPSANSSTAGTTPSTPRAGSFCRRGRTPRRRQTENGNEILGGIYGSRSGKEQQGVPDGGDRLGGGLFP